METIKLEELAPYLPYGLKASLSAYDNLYLTIDGISSRWVIFTNGKQLKIDEIKPVLIPLSELKNTNAYEDISRACEERMVPEYYHIRLEKNYSPLGMPYWVNIILLKYHFDVFGLIDRGLALSKATL